MRGLQSCREFLIALIDKKTKGAPRFTAEHLPFFQSMHTKILFSVHFCEHRIKNTILMADTLRQGLHNMISIYSNRAVWDFLNRDHKD